MIKLSYGIHYCIKNSNFNSYGKMRLFGLLIYTAFEFSCLGQNEVLWMYKTVKCFVDFLLRSGNSIGKRPKIIRGGYASFSEQNINFCWVAKTFYRTQKSLFVVEILRNYPFLTYLNLFFCQKPNYCPKGPVSKRVDKINSTRILSLRNNWSTLHIIWRHLIHSIEIFFIMEILSSGDKVHMIAYFFMGRRSTQSRFLWF